MKRIIIYLLLCCVVCSIFACGKEDEKEDSTPEGIHYQMFSDTDIKYVYNSGECYSCSLLDYDGKIYSSTKNYSSDNKEDLNLDILGDELADVYGNYGIYWSEEKEKLYESNITGKVYAINGQDDSFYVGLYYENKELDGTTYYCMNIYESINDIYLNEGKDLYEDRYSLSKSSKIEVYDGSREMLGELSVSDDYIKKLNENINKGKFIEEDDEVEKILKSYDLIFNFVDENDIEVELWVYEEGYVVLLKHGQRFVLRLDDKVDLNVPLN